jgi:hypothetical protein
MKLNREICEKRINLNRKDEKEKRIRTKANENRQAHKVKNTYFTQNENYSVVDPDPIFFCGTSSGFRIQGRDVTVSKIFLCEKLFNKLITKRQ